LPSLTIYLDAEEFEFVYQRTGVNVSRKVRGIVRQQMKSGGLV